MMRGFRGFVCGLRIGNQTERTDNTFHYDARTIVTVLTQMALGDNRGISR
jgi:hypothetical protein